MHNSPPRNAIKPPSQCHVNSMQVNAHTHRCRCWTPPCLLLLPSYVLADRLSAVQLQPAEYDDAGTQLQVHGCMPQHRLPDCPGPACPLEDPTPLACAVSMAAIQAAHEHSRHSPAAPHNAVPGRFACILLHAVLRTLHTPHKPPAINTTSPSPHTVRGTDSSHAERGAHRVSHHVVQPRAQGITDVWPWGPQKHPHNASRYHFLQHPLCQKESRPPPQQIPSLLGTGSLQAAADIFQVNCLAPATAFSACMHTCRQPTFATLRTCARRYTHSPYSTVRSIQCQSAQSQVAEGWSTLPPSPPTSDITEGLCCTLQSSALLARHSARTLNCLAHRSYNSWR